MTVYIDLILAENIILNFIILFATAIILKIKTHFLRLLVASVIGAILSALEYFSSFGRAQIFIKFSISVLLNLIAFESAEFKTFTRNLLAFYLVTMVFGGTAFMFMFLVKPQNAVFHGGHFVGLYPIKMAMIGCCFGFGLTYLTFKMIKKSILKYKKICKIEICYKNKVVNLKALVDSR